MNFRKVNVIAGAIIVVAICSSYYLISENNTNGFVFVKNEINNKTRFIPYEIRRWNTYIDSQYKYSLKFPDKLNIFHLREQGIGVLATTTSGSFLMKEGVNFGDPELNNYWVISVSVSEKTNILNVDEWLKKEGMKSEHQRPVVEKRIVVDGCDAIVTYMQSDYELDEVTKSEKNTVFIKNGNLFEIRTRFSVYSNHERVWNNFKFDQL